MFERIAQIGKTTCPALQHSKERKCSMPYLFIRHKVTDYPKWKSAFDKHGDTRQANGSRGGQLFRNANDPNELIILFEWDDLERARQFTQSEDLRQTMQRAGVVGQPDIYYLEAVEHLPV